MARWFFWTLWTLTMSSSKVKVVGKKFMVTQVQTHDEEQLNCWVADLGVAISHTVLAVGYREELNLNV